MHTPRGLSIGLLLAAAVSAGCAGPRLLSADQRGGCVAIPSDTDDWPCYYRSAAEKLIEQQCPHGYAIVKQEAVAVGQTTTTSYRHETRDQQELPELISEAAKAATKNDRPQDRTEWRIWFEKQ